MSNQTMVDSLGRRFRHMSRMKRDQEPTRRNAHKPKIYRLIFLDESIDESDSEWKRLLVDFRGYYAHIDLYRNSDCCVDDLSDIDVKDPHVALVVSWRFAPTIIPAVHDFSCLYRIYIKGDLDNQMKSRVKCWPKFKGILPDLQCIRNALKPSGVSIHQVLLPMSFTDMDENNDGTQRSTRGQLDSTFMYTKLIRDALLTMHYTEQSTEDIVNHCRKTQQMSASSETLLNEFSNNYHADDVIRWYTRECFTYAVLNNALRSLDANVIVLMGFFLCDLHRRIEKLHKEQIGSYHEKTFVVYRGQPSSNEDFQNLFRNKGGSMAFNSFLSTTKDWDVAEFRAQAAVEDEDMLGIIFDLTVDPQIRSATFADVSQESFFPEEAEILFSMNTVFRIEEVNPLHSSDRLFQVKLTLVEDDDKRLRELTDKHKLIMSELSDVGRIAHILIEIEEYEMVLQLCHKALENVMNDDKKKFECYRYIGLAKLDKKDHQQSLECFWKALSIYQKESPEMNLNPSIYLNEESSGQLATSVNHGCSGHTTANSLSESERVPLVNTPSFTTTQGEMGRIYLKQRKYSEAHQYLRRALVTGQKELTPNHPYMARIHSAMSQLHQQTGALNQAVICSKKALEIRQTSLPSDHSQVLDSHRELADLYRKRGESAQADIHDQTARDFEARRRVQKSSF